MGKLPFCPGGRSLQPCLSKSSQRSVHGPIAAVAALAAAAVGDGARTFSAYRRRLGFPFNRTLEPWPHGRSLVL